MYIVGICRYCIRRNESLDALLIVISYKIKIPCIWVPNEYKYVCLLCHDMNNR